MNDGVNKLVSRMAKPSEEQDDLRSFLESSQPQLEQTPIPAAPPQPNNIPPQSNALRAMDAQVLKGKQDASESLIGQLFGMQGLTEEEKKT